MTTLLIWLLPYAIQYKRGGWYLVAAVIAGVLDILANHTSFSYTMREFPRRSFGRYEWTITQRLRRLQSNTDFRGPIARGIVVLLNEIEPGHVGPSHARNEEDERTL